MTSSAPESHSNPPLICNPAASPVWLVNNEPPVSPANSELLYPFAEAMLLLVKNPFIRISIGVLIGILILVAVNWSLRLALKDHETLYAGKSLDEWQQQLESHDAGASNLAVQTLNAQIIPQLVDQMYHDTNDSKVRLWAVDTLNSVPGARICFTPADGRRSAAAYCLGTFGPVAKAAVPSLIQALRGPDAASHESVIQALGHIHSDPDVVIPRLIPFLGSNDLADEAATALSKYGSLAKPAFPKIVPLLKSSDKDVWGAAIRALKKIDPEAAAKIGLK